MFEVNSHFQHVTVITGIPEKSSEWPGCFFLRCKEIQLFPNRIQMYENQCSDCYVTQNGPQ